MRNYFAQLVSWMTYDSHYESQVMDSLDRSVNRIIADSSRLKEENSESFFTIAELRKQLADTETDRLKWKRESEVSNLHLAGERRSNAALKGQITKLKGARRG